MAVRHRAHGQLLRRQRTRQAFHALHRGDLRFAHLLALYCRECYESLPGECAIGLNMYPLIDTSIDTDYFHFCPPGLQQTSPDDADGLRSRLLHAHQRLSAMLLHDVHVGRHDGKRYRHAVEHDEPEFHPRP
ncbi:unnamed protein product, partial [Nesidiocoris tenuis]